MLPARSAQVHYDPVLLDLCYLQDLLKSTMICFSRSMLPARSAQVHYDPVLLDLLPAGTDQVHYDLVLLDLCYLQDLLKSTMTLFF